jgi:hypothetical protein
MNSTRKHLRGFGGPKDGGSQLRPKPPRKLGYTL